MALSVAWDEDAREELGGLPAAERRAVMTAVAKLEAFGDRLGAPHSSQVKGSRVGIRELFTGDPERERRYFPVRSPLNHVFFALDRVGRTLEPLIPKWVRRHALRRAEAWFTERLYRVPLGFCYDPLIRMPPVATSPAAAGRNLVFGSLNQPAKLSSATVATWSEKSLTTTLRPGALWAVPSVMTCDISFGSSRSRGPSILTRGPD